MIRTNRGDGGSAELHTTIGAGPFRFTPGREYLLRTEYINVGSQRRDVRGPVRRRAAAGQDRRPAPADRRAVADGRVPAHRPAHERSTTYFTYNRSVAPDFLVVRSVQVFELPADAPPPPAAARPQVVWESDFAKAPRFRGTMAKPGGLKMDEGRLPDEWQAYVWKQGSAGEVALEEFAGKTGIAFRTTSGDAAAEITTHGRTPKDLLKAGRRYRVDVEYAAPGGPGGRLDVRLDDPAKPGATPGQADPDRGRLADGGSRRPGAERQGPDPVGRTCPTSGSGRRTRSTSSR